MAIQDLILTFVCILLLVPFVFSQPPNPPAPTEYYFTQNFDHINPRDDRVFLQRYLIYDKYYTGEGPIFFCPGGESNVYDGYNHNGFMFELGQKLGAFLLFPEHRFYGESLPFGPVDSYTPDNIKKLTVEQAMYDYIVIINRVKNVFNIPDITPLISFGGSYPGDLTVYMRVGFPDIIDAGFGSSAPLLYHIGGVPSGAFYEVITQDFEMADPQCPNLVREAFYQIMDKSKTVDGRVEITQKLQLCYPLAEGDAATRLLALWVENAFATLGMGDYPYPLYGMPKFPLQASCNVMKSYSDPIVGLGKTIGVFYNATGSLSCFNISDEYYPCADITGCGGGVGDPDAMSWDYQSCTEIVSNVDTNNMTDMFPNAPYDFNALVQYCNKTWNAVPNPSYIPEKYNYLTTTHLILSNGKLDPWYPGGVLPDNCPKTQDIYCFLIDDAAHHLDLRGSDPVNDPPAVVATRIIEESIIISWVEEIFAKKKAKMNIMSI